MNDTDKTNQKKGKLIIRNNDHLFDLNRISWQPRGELTQSDWEEIGTALGQLKSSSQWWIGDWWAYGEHRYGDRKAIIDSDDWQGVSYGTCRDYAMVAKAFELSERYDNLSFSHHDKVITLPKDWRKKLLDWACEPLKQGKLKPHSVRVLEQKVKEVKRQLELEDHSKSNQSTEQLVEQKVPELPEQLDAKNEKLQQVSEAKELATKMNHQWQSEIVKLQKIKQELDQQSLLLKQKEDKLNQTNDSQANAKAKIIAQQEIEEQKTMFEKQQKYLSTAEDIAKHIQDISWYFKTALTNLEIQTKPDQYPAEDLAKNFPEEYHKTTANLLEAVHEMKCFADRILDIYTNETTTTIIDI
jgi:hypothetical protein